MHDYYRKIKWYSAICMAVSVITLFIMLYILVIVDHILPSGSLNLGEYDYIIGFFMAVFIPSVYLPLYKATYPGLTFTYFFALAIFLFIAYDAGGWIFLVPVLVVGGSYGSVRRLKEYKNPNV